MRLLAAARVAELFETIRSLCHAKLAVQQRHLLTFRRGTTRARPRHAPATTRPGHVKFRTWGWENSGQGSAGQEQQNNGQGSKTDHGFRAHRAARKSEAKARPPCHGPARRRGSVVGIPMHERNVASPVRSIAGRTAQHLSSSTWTCDMTRAWTWIWGLTPTKPVFAKGVAATGVVQPVQSACSPCYLVCIVASRGDVREGFEGLREEADLESLGAMPKYSAGRVDTVGMRSETITVSTCTQRPHRTWSGARTGTRSGSFGFFDCMAEAGTAALAGHSPRVDAPPLRGRARRVADAGDGPAGTEKAIRRRCEPPSVADGDGRIHNIGMTFVYHSHIM